MPFLNQALKEAHKAYQKDEVPIGAVIVLDNKIIARAHNQVETKNDCTAHAELLAIQKATKKLGYSRLLNCHLFTTLEPCPMCAGAILQARIKTVTYGAKDHKWGAHQTKTNLFTPQIFNHTSTIIFTPNEECSALLTTFFKTKR